MKKATKYLMSGFESLKVKNSLTFPRVMINYYKKINK